MNKIASISLIVASLAAASPAHAGGGASFAGGFAGGLAGGLISGAINAATQAHQQPRTVVVERRTVVVHDRSTPHHSSASKKSTADPTPSPAATPVPASTPVPEATPMSASTPLPIPVVNHGPTYAITDPVKIDHPADLTPKELALTQDKHAVLDFFEDYFKRTTPQNSLADSSLFMEVQIGAYNYLVAKITVNTEAGTLVKGFVIDLKNEFFSVMNLDTYHEFMHTGNINLLGERVLNPLD